MTKVKITRLGALLLAVLTVLGGPGSIALAAAPEALTLAIVASENMVIAPLNMSERDPMSLLTLMYEGLIELDDDQRPQPCLAETWDVASSGKRWTFHLRSGVTFHDGTPLTSADVVATLDAIWALAGYDADKKTEVALVDRGLYANLYAYVDSWKAIDEMTVQINASRPYYGLLNAMTFPILPASQVGMPEPPGTGPYRLQEYTPGERLWVTAWHGWWRMPPAVINIIATICPDPLSALDEFEYSRVDVAMTRALAASRYSGSLRSLMVPYRTRQMEVLLMHHAVKPLDNVNVRLAIASAIDTSSLSKHIYQNMATPINTTVLPGTWLYDADAAARGYDPEYAMQLLDLEGWEMKEDGRRYKTVGGESRKLVLRILTYEEPGASVRRSAATSINEMLSAVGIGSTISTGSQSDVSEALRVGNFDLILCGYNMDVVPDPGFLLQSGVNLCRYKSEDMNKLISDLRKQYEPGAYQQAMFAIQQLFVKEMPFVPLYYRGGTLLTRNSFTSVRDVREMELLRGIEALR